MVPDINWVLQKDTLDLSCSLNCKAEELSTFYCFCLSALGVFFVSFFLISTLEESGFSV